MSLDINQIKNSLKQALEVLHIKKVIYIDDAFADSYSLTDVIGTIEYLINTQNDINLNKKISYLKTVEFEAPKESWEFEVSELWKTYKTHQKKQLIDLLNKIDNPVIPPEYQQDIFVDANIKKVLPTEIEFIQVSPSKWINEKEELLSTADESNKILCFFDQELKYDEEYDSKREGIELLKEILALKNENIVCTLITHLTTIESEIDYWKTLSEQHSLKLSDFLTLSKRRVDSNVELASGIRLTLLNHKCESLKDYAVEITNKANELASKDLSKINVYDFYHMVLKSSEKEGIWEAQTLFRIHSIFQELHSRKLALETETRQCINSNISMLRGLIGKENQTTNTSWEIRRKELFYDENLNVLNLPLQNGDIFFFEQIEKNYILLAQPCDLMIRKNGNRKFRTGVLAEVVSTPPSTESYITIPYFDSRNGRGAFVNFKSIITIDLDILDLSIFNEDGKCTFVSDQDLSTFHTPLINRFEKNIKKALSVKKQRCLGLIKGIQESNIESTQKQELVDAVIFQGFELNKDVVSVELSEIGINFNIKRKGTYRSPYSDSLLEDYSKYISRSAAEHDFAIPEEELKSEQKEEVIV
ncbi:TPA: hypothetical protein QCX17_002250 [Bacillus cereus]|nr:hypothetical protein [Bacillus cereus]